ncbi:CRISPR-associated endonuclease Cas6 [Phocaeicola coprocola]|uniref:CRISPR-associated endonuclease Cas6 n=1 Tax=Phocaeicola coprocola TaxID=310298 RepID=UPI003FD76D76
MRNIRILILKFRNQLQPNEIKWFRGAVIHALSKDDVLFHNHIDKNYRYAYPLIQYKLINRCATILCIEEGVEAIGNFFSNYNNLIQIGEKNMSLEIDYLRPSVFLLEVTERVSRYSLHRWIPLNHENYQVYRTLEKDEQRIHLLQKILIGNILSCLKGLNIYLDKRITCRIQEITRMHTISNKGVNLLAFDLIFTANLSLPPYIGLGKNASINCGILTLAHKN